jgi:acetylornithine/succinyldiaminopimelate/putrescine aminotransferase
MTAENSAVLIADEIQCGLGRTGRYFGYEKFSSKPDIVVIAKPLAAGLPLGAILASDAVAEKIGPGLHGSTFGGGPLVCATALEFLKTVEDNKLLENVRARGTELRAGLAALAKKFNFIREIRGEGLMIGVELSIEGAPFVTEATRRGLLMNCTHDFTLRVLPPFIVTKAQVREFLQLFESVLASNTTSKAESVPAAKKPESSPRLARSAAR